MVKNSEVKKDLLYLLEQNMPIVKEFKNEMFNQTIEYQKKYSFELGSRPGHETWNNEADAFKHTFMQAVGAMIFGNVIAYVGGRLHERNGNKYLNQSKQEENMDLWNNYQGRQIAKELRKEYNADSIQKLIENKRIYKIIAEKVIQKMRNGELITHPSDKRKYTGFAANIIPLQYNDQKGNVVYYTGQEPTIDELENLSLKDRVIYDTEVNLANEEDDVVDRFAEQYYNNESYTKDDLDERVKSGELIYVESYCRSDGTKVSGYYRRKRI